MLLCSAEMLFWQSARLACCAEMVFSQSARLACCSEMVLWQSKMAPLQMESISAMLITLCSCWLSSSLYSPFSLSFFFLSWLNSSTLSDQQLIKAYNFLHTRKYLPLFVCSWACSFWISYCFYSSLATSSACSSLATRSVCSTYMIAWTEQSLICFGSAMLGSQGASRLWSESRLV